MFLINRQSYGPVAGDAPSFFARLTLIQSHEEDHSPLSFALCRAHTSEVEVRVCSTLFNFPPLVTASAAVDFICHPFLPPPPSSSTKGGVPLCRFHDNGCFHAAGIEKHIIIYIRDIFIEYSCGILKLYKQGAFARHITLEQYGGRPREVEQLPDWLKMARDCWPSVTHGARIPQLMKHSAEVRNTFICRALLNHGEFNVGSLRIGAVPRGGTLSLPE